MKKISLFLFCASILSCSSVLSTQKITPVDYNRRLLVAVGDIQNKTGNAEYDRLAENCSGNFIYELHETGCFRLVERERLQNLLKEINLSMTGLVDPSRTKEIGKMLGVDAILFVTLSSVSRTSQKSSSGFAQSEVETISVSMDARLVRVETGEILAASRIVTPFTNVVSSFMMMKNGGKADTVAAAGTCIDASLKSLAHEIAKQASPISR